jgi:hypothetical protein
MHLIHFLQSQSDENFRIVNVHVEMKMANTIDLLLKRSQAIENLDLTKFNDLNDLIRQLA